jgi:hypothetical protein
MTKQLYAAGKTVRYFPQLYVGLRKVNDYVSKGHIESYIMGFLTPYEVNQAGRKRKESVDLWANKVSRIIEFDAAGEVIQTPYGQPYKMEQKIPAEIFKNEPLRGFRVANMVRRYETSNVVWRVEDPRGFQLELSSDNLAYLLSEQGIGKGGEIFAPCLWARIGAQNYLVPVNTELWPDSLP